MYKSIKLDFAAKEDYFFPFVSTFDQSDFIVIGSDTNRVTTVKLNEASLEDSIINPFNPLTDFRSYLTLAKTSAQQKIG